MFDDDPGIMSEAETSSTRSQCYHLTIHLLLLLIFDLTMITIFFMIRCRRKNKPKSNALPVVRTPSKTLERPLGE